MSPRDVGYLEPLTNEDLEYHGGQMCGLLGSSPEGNCICLLPFAHDGSHECAHGGWA